MLDIYETLGALTALVIVCFLIKKFGEHLRKKENSKG